MSLPDERPTARVPPVRQANQRVALLNAPPSTLSSSFTPVGPAVVASSYAMEVYFSPTPINTATSASLPRAPTGLYIRLDDYVGLQILLDKTAYLYFNGHREEYRRKIHFCELESIARSSTPQQCFAFPFTCQLMSELGYALDPNMYPLQPDSLVATPVRVEPLTIWNATGACLVRLEQWHSFTLTQEQHRTLVINFGLVVIAGLASDYLDSLYSTAGGNPGTCAEVVSALSMWMTCEEFERLLAGTLPSGNRIDGLTACQIQPCVKTFSAAVARYGVDYLISCFSPDSIQNWFEKFQKCRVQLAQPFDGRTSQMGAPYSTGVQHQSQSAVPDAAGHAQDQLTTTADDSDNASADDPMLPIFGGSGAIL